MPKSFYCAEGNHKECKAVDCNCECHFQAKEAICPKVSLSEDMVQLINQQVDIRMAERPSYVSMPLYARPLTKIKFFSGSLEEYYSPDLPGKTGMRGLEEEINEFCKDKKIVKMDTMIIQQLILTAVVYED